MDNLFNFTDMKLRVLSLVGVLAFTAGTVIHAQDYDDIYYDGGKSTTEVKETKKVVTTKSRTQVPTSYKVTVEKNYQTERDIDEYNRRGGIYAQTNDTLYLDDYEDEGTFANTQRIERFYNPDIVIASDDVDLIELYYDNTPNVTLIIGSNYGYTPRVGWGIGFGTYWYDPWFDPFFYNTRWFGWDGWYGWHRPYWRTWGWGYYNWGWHSAWWGWHDPWGRPWGHHGPYLWGHRHVYNNSNRWHAGHHSNRLPGDNRSLLTGSRRGTGMTTAGATGLRGNNGTTRGNVGTINNGRTRPSSMGGNGSVTTGRTRPSTSMGNVDRATPSTTRSTGGFSGGSVRNRGISSSSSRSSSGYSGSSSRSSSSYGGSRSSGSYSSGSRSSGGYSSGSSRGGGGYSGGSSRGGGSSSGGGRRH